jgi:type VI protein secretion system component VasF
MNKDYYNSIIICYTTVIIKTKNILKQVEHRKADAVAAGLRHEPPSPSRTLGLWVRIPVEAWIPVCAFILCLCCSVCR